jgi:hypothetical protein
MGEQVLFVLEVVVENPVSDLSLPGDVADGQPGAAALADKPRGGGDQVVTQALAIAVTQDGWFPRSHRA